MVNLEDQGIAPQTLSMLNKWIEQRLRQMIHGAFLPQEATRYVFLKSYNRHGIAMYNVQIFEGLDYIRSTAPREYNDVDEFGFAFYSLSEHERIVILSWVDPFQELESREEWRDYLRECGIGNNCDNRLVDAMLNLQEYCEKRGVVKAMAQDGLRTWPEIAEYLRVSVPTAVKMAKSLKLPITIISGTIYTTKAKLDEFFDKHIDSNPYYLQKKKKKK